MSDPGSIPPTLPAVVFDRVLDAFAQVGEMMIEMELDFDRALDGERLRRALELVLDAEPVLGCELEAGFFGARWRRLPPGRRENLLVLEAGDRGADDADLAAAYARFKHAPIDAEPGPQVRGCLWRRPGGDRLLLKVGHRAADAGGTKEVVAAVAALYRALGEDPDHRPAPNLTGSRGIGQILRRVPWYAFPRIYLNYLTAFVRLSVPLRTFALVMGGSTDEHVFVEHRIGAGRVAAAVAYGRERGARINDLLVAAFFRAQRAVEGPRPGFPHRLMTTVDLRRWYLPGGRGEAVTNLSNFEYPCLGHDLGPDLDATVARVVAFTRRRKASYLGLSDVVGGLPGMTVMPNGLFRRAFLALMRFSQRRGHMPNALTNLGPIAPEVVDFDGPPVRAFTIVPPIHAPALGVGLSGYEGTLTLTAGVHPSSADRVRAFFEAIEAELTIDT